MKKRFIGIVLAIFMIIGQIPGAMYEINAKDGDIPGYLTIGDFSGTTLDSRLQTFQTPPLMSQNTNVAYGDGEGCLEWKMPTSGGNDLRFRINGSDGVDLRDYSKIHIRFASSAPSNKFNIIFVSDESATSSKYNKFTHTTAASSGEWNECVITRASLSYLASNDYKLEWIKFDHAGWGNTGYVSGSSVYIDKIWATTQDYEDSAKIPSPTPDIDDGASYVTSDLGGDNTIEYTFTKKLASMSNVNDWAKVYEITDSGESLTTKSYTVSVSDTKLLITFENNLENGAYKIVLDSTKIYSDSGAMLSGDFQSCFYVGIGSPYFNVTATVPNHDATEVPVFTDGNFEYKINFSKPLNPDTDYSSFIDLIRDKDNKSLNGAITNVVASDASLVINIDSSKLYGNTKYNVELSEDFSDIDGIKIQDDRLLSFTSCEKNPLAPDGVVFDASNHEDMFSHASVSAENTIGYNEVVAVNFVSGTSGTENRISCRKANLNNYTHLNILLYNENSESINYNLKLSSGSSQYMRYSIPADFEGWKVYTSPLSATSSNTGPDKSSITQWSINVGGWGNKPIKDGSVKIARMWLSNEAPSSSFSYNSSEFGTEADNVPLNLGGDNSVSFNFSHKLRKGNYSEAVKLEKYNGTDFVDVNNRVDVFVSSDSLCVGIDNASAGDTYRITLDGYLLSENYEVLKADASSVITLEAAAPYFKVKETSLSEGEGIPLSNFESYTVTFNNSINSSLKLSDYVFVYKDGARQYSGYKLEADGRELSLSFDKAPDTGAYEIRLSKEFNDIYGNSISGITEFKFSLTEENTSTETDYVLFSGDNDDHIASYISQAQYITENTTNTNNFAKNIKFEIPQGSQRDLRFLNTALDASGYRYFNIMMYAPPEVVEQNNIMNLVIYKNEALDSYARHKISLKEGWNIVSVSVSPATYYRIMINFGGWNTPWDTAGYVLIEKAWLSASEPEDMELMGISEVNNYRDALVIGQEFEFEFTNTLLNSQTPAISVSDAQGNLVSDYSYAINGSTLKISFSELKPDTKYTVKITELLTCQLTNLKTPVEYSFSTRRDGLYVYNMDFDKSTIGISGDVINASYTVNNLNSSSADLKTVLFALDDEGKLVSYDESHINVAALSSMGVTKKIATTDDTAFVKLLCLNGDKIVSDTAVVLSKSAKNKLVSGSENTLTNEISINKIVLSENILSISGKSAMNNSLVALYILSSDGTVIGSDVMLSDENGELCYDTMLPSLAKTGSYTVRIIGNGKKADRDFFYQDASDRESFYKLANGSDKIALAEFIRTHRGMIGISSLDNELSTDFAKIILSANPYDDYTEVYNKLLKSADAFKALNSSVWNTMAAVIDANADILLYEGSDEKFYFSTLEEKGKNEICLKLAPKLSFASISEFITSFDNVAKAHRDSKDTSSKPGNSKNPPSSSTSVSIGGGGYTGGGAALPSEPKPENNKAFKDLSGFKWAEDSINYLYNKGIISPSVDGNYRPGDNITREEFVKLIVVSFFPNLVGADEAIYADAPLGTWYNKYLAAATKAGITNGNGSGSFGVGDYITREDMVTMAGRALEKAGYALEAGKKTDFTDAGAISDYAIAYVNALSQKKIINGIGNGSFAPKNNADRAQSAKVIYELIKLFN